MLNGPRPAPADELLEHGDGLIEMDQDWVIVRVNAAQERTTRKPRSETLGRVFWEVWPEMADPGGAQWRAYHRCLGERVPVEIQDYYPLFDVWFHITAYPTSTGGIAVFFRDITVQKRAERALELERTHWRGVVEGIAEELWVCDAEGRVSLVNLPDVTAMGLEPFGRKTVDEVLREVEITYSDGRPRPAEEAPLLRALRTGQVLRGEEIMHHRASGLVRHRQYSCAPTRDERGRITGAVAIVRDITAQKKAQEELRTSEAALEAFFAASPGILNLQDEEFRYVKTDPLTPTYFGLTRDSIVGRAVADLAPPFIEKFGPMMRRVIETGEPALNQEVFSPVPGRPNEVTSWRASYFPVPLPGGKRGIGIMGVEITDLRRAEQAHREAAERFETLADNIAQLAWMADENGWVFWYNRRWFEYTGTTLDEMKGWGWQEVHHPHHVDRVHEKFRRHVESGERWEDTFPLRSKTGEYRWFLSRAIPIRDDRGKVVRWFGTNTDITEQRAAEVALRTSEARLRSILESMSEGLMLFDPEGNFTYQNPASLRLHGFEPDDPGQIAHQDVPVNWKVSDKSGRPLPLEQWPVSRVCRQERVQGEVLHVERTETGLKFSASYNGAPLHDASGQLVGGFITIRDITDAERTQDQLRSANERLVAEDRRKNEFLGMLSHELRNPLAPIRNALFILDHAQPEGQQARRAKDIARRQVAHLTRLVDDLLDVTRIARGRIELRHEELDVAALVRRTAEDYRPLLQDRGLDLALDVVTGPVLVNGDPARLTQVFGNLLNNAAKFTPAGGRVSLSLRPGSDHVVVHVQDTGPGIAPDVLPSLFEPFTQGKQTLARTEGGLGLGLSLVKGIVTLHRGTVTVSSPARGGADFVVSLPLSRPMTTDRTGRSPAPSPSPASGASRHHVLVVDDNHDAAESLRELMQLLGQDVEVAYDGPSAIAEASRTHPDVVLCDIGLPGMDGYEVARELRAQHDGDLRIVALSGYAQPEDVERAFEAGFDAHVAKPPDPEQISHILECRGCRRATDSPFPGVTHAP